MSKFVFAVILCFLSVGVSAATWISSSGKIENLVTYAHTETVLVYLDTDGTDVSACSNKTAFAISANMSEEGRSRMFAMLLSAQARDEEVVVSYLDVGGCEPWFSSPNVYRQITVLK